MALPIRGTSLGNPQDTARIAIERGGLRPANILRYAVALWAACDRLGIRADAAFAQADLETGTFTSTRWTREGNPAGLGITTGMPDSDVQRTLTPEEWAEIQAIHLGGYAGIDPGPELRAKDFRWQAMVNRGWFGVAETYQDLDEKWAEDQGNYGDKIESRWRNYGFPAMRPADDPPDDGGTGGSDMAYKTVIPGLPGGPLETSFPVKILTPPAWRTNVRPGIKARTPRLSVQHETANPNTMAYGDANYLYNGSGGRQASWHFTIDDIECYTGIPVDEVTWQAGDGSGPGNMNGISCELAVHSAIVNNASRRAQSQKNAAEILGKVGARLNATPPARQHANFMNKNCPAQMRNRGEWNRYVDWWEHFRDMELAAMRGEPPKDDEVPEVIHIGDTLRATVPLNFRQAPSLTAPIIVTLPVGAEVLVSGPWESADGYGWLPVTHTLATGNVTGYIAQGGSDGMYVEVAKRGEPETPEEPDPTYVERQPIPALLETDLQKYDTAEGITTDQNENEFIFVADVIEFTEETVAGEYATETPRPVKAPYKAGERAIAAWLVKAAHGAWFYVLAGADDEWIRVPYANTRRISDAPLLGDDTP